MTAAKRERTRYHGLDSEVAAFDRQHEIVRGGSIRGHNVNVDAELPRKHTARVLDAAGVVQYVTDGQRMQHGASGARGMSAARSEHACNIALPDRRAGNLDGSGDQFTCRAARGNRD